MTFRKIQAYQVTGVFDPSPRFEQDRALVYFILERALLDIARCSQGSHSKVGREAYKWLMDDSGEPDTPNWWSDLAGLDLQLCCFRALAKQIKTCTKSVRVSLIAPFIRTQRTQ